MPAVRRPDGIQPGAGGNAISGAGIECRRDSANALRGLMHGRSARKTQYCSIIELHG